MFLSAVAGSNPVIIGAICIIAVIAVGVWLVVRKKRGHTSTIQPESVDTVTTDNVTFCVKELNRQGTAESAWIRESRRSSFLISPP